MVITTILHKLFFLYAPGTACSQQHLKCFFVLVGGGGGEEGGGRQSVLWGLVNTVIAFMPRETLGKELQCLPHNKRPSKNYPK